MISNGRPVKEVAESLGIGENLNYRWRSSQESKGKENASATIDQQDQQTLLRRIRELEMEHDILKKLSPFSVGRPKREVPFCQSVYEKMDATGSMPGAPAKP